MAEFTFSKEEYLKMVHEAMNMPIEKIQPTAVPQLGSVDKLLQLAGRRKQIRPVSVPRA